MTKDEITAKYKKRNAEIKALREGGLTLKEIAKLKKISKQRVSEILARNYLKKHKLTNKEIHLFNEVIKDKGINRKQWCIINGLSYSTTSHFFAKKNKRSINKNSIAYELIMEEINLIK